MASIDNTTAGVSPKPSPDNLKPDMAKVRSGLINIKNAVADVHDGINVLVTIGERDDVNHLGLGWLAGQLYYQVEKIKAEIDHLREAADPGERGFIKDVMECGAGPAAGAA